MLAEYFDDDVHEAPKGLPLDELVNGLNPPQAEAVQHTEGPILVLAGAGTGKTRVLTNRIAYMLMTQVAQPHEILAVTFTNKAAKEMTERMEKLLGYPPHGMWLGTFHRLGVRFLRMHAEMAGLKPGFVILDADDQQRLITQITKDVGLDSQQFPPRLVTHIISRFKDDAYTVETLPSSEAQELMGKAGEIYAIYQQRLRELNAVDFGDLLLHPLTILLKNENLRQQYQSNLRYILVDEYQDTNTVQYLWLKVLAAQHQNICVVGDDDQSIYGWRGAQVGNILKFEQDFKGAHVVRLEQNYRSTAHILASANAVIANNRQRHEKALWTDAGHGNLVEVHPVMDDREESRFIADRCMREVRSTVRSYNDLAVLVRTAAQTRSLEEQFIKVGLPYVVVGGQKFYDRKEIKDMMAYLRVVANPTDDLALQRIINVPKRGVGDVSLQAIDAEAKRLGIGWLEATEELLNTGYFGGKAGHSLTALVQLFRNWKGLEQISSLADLLKRIMEDSGYKQMLLDDKEDDGKARVENINSLINAMQEYDDLNAFLEHVALVSDADTESTENVRLMTIHAAKGLEFPLVFLPGFEEGIFPHKRALDEEGTKGLEEERRLAYVAITRAREELIISYASTRRMYGQFTPCMPSRFLREIPADHLDMKPATGHSYSQYGGGVSAWGSQGFSRPGQGMRTVGSSSYSQGGSQNGGGYSQRSYDSGNSYQSRKVSDAPTQGMRPHTPTRVPEGKAVLTFGDGRSVDLSTLKAEQSYKAGQRVHHEKFGPGRVSGVEGKGAEQKVIVEFVQAGTKRLLVRLAKLEVQD
jgi:DNA helicase II / ATP-dependent DNA helicase PcrA